MKDYSSTFTTDKQQIKSFPFFDEKLIESVIPIDVLRFQLMMQRLTSPEYLINKIVNYKYF